MMRRKLSLLESPLFVGSLTLLAVNDLFLKSIEINWLTGKLSDFAGLTALYLVLIALWPRRAIALGWMVAAGWIVWKTPLSVPILEAIESVTDIRYLRVEDLTDLLALAVLPFVHWYATQEASDRSAFTLQTGLGVTNGASCLRWLTSSERAICH